VPELDSLKESIDCCKIRIEEYDRNYFSLRELEWRISFQFLTAYIGIGIGFNYLYSSALPYKSILVYWCLGLSAVLFLAYVFFSLCLRQRLAYSRARKREYVKQLHGYASVAQCPEELDDEKSKLWLPNWWAYITQIVTHTSAFATLIAFILLR
jgi:hypothetical protein